MIQQLRKIITIIMRFFNQKEKQYMDLRKKIDSDIEKLPNCCSKGCSFCCFQPIEIFDFEKKTIKNAIKKLDTTTKNNIKINLESWFNLLNANTVGSTTLEGNDILQLFQNMSPNKHQCPLLINNLCSIYDDRPLACRLHVVEYNIQSCNADPYRWASNASFNVRRQMLVDLQNRGEELQLLYLPYIATEIIPINTPIKPIKKWII